MDFATGVQNFRDGQRERSQAIDARPLVQRECICPNHHNPVDGIVVSSPACLEHGLRCPYVVHDGRAGLNMIWIELAQATSR